MHIEYLEKKKPLPDPAPAYESDPASKSDSSTPSQLEQYLLQLDGEVHRPAVTEILCTASMWAYSDLTTFASWMTRSGLFGEFVGINVSNDVAFVDTTAYLYLSESKNLAILAFRGTELTNPVNWLADVSAKMAEGEEGGIHSGFLTAALVVLPILRELLLEWARSSTSLADTLRCLRRKSPYPKEAFPTEAQLRQPGTIGAPPEDSDEESLTKGDVDELADKVASKVVEELAESQDELKPGLYITGHSLGGAFASLAGAEIYLEPALTKVKRRLRSIYTFGAPMWADKTYVATLEQKGLDKRLFRHRYEKDVVPLLPARSQGEYKHLGCAYKSSKGVWVRSNYGEEQANMAIMTIFWGLMPFLTESVAAWKWFGINWFNQPWLISWLFPYSWTDHEPLRYLRVSQAGRSGFEILGNEVVGLAPVSCDDTVKSNKPR